MFDEHVRQPLRDAPMTDDEKAARLVAAFSVLLPSVTTLVAHHFRRVLLEVAQEHLEAVGHESRDRGRERRGGPAARGPVARLKHRARCPNRPRRRAAVDAMFDTIAPRYDRLNRILTFGLDVAWRRTAVRCARGSRPAHGCSTSPAAPATSAASSERGGRAGRARPLGGHARRRGRGTRVPLVRGDGLVLPVRDAAFDGVTCGFALRNVVALDPLFAECARRAEARRAVRVPRGRRTGARGGARRAPRLLPSRRALRRRVALRSRRLPIPARLDRVPPAPSRARGRPRRGRLHRRDPAAARPRRRATHRAERLP